jgi:aryl-alcohol dehydrogenase-like predicted oxidoreductase
MEYRTLGRTGLKVSPLCLGAMMFGSFGNTDHDDSIRIIHAALDAGINFVDTADVYSFGESEEIVGKALAQTKRHKVVLATKVHGQMGQDPNAQGNSRRWIMAACDNSLRRLGVDYIDIYQIHRPRRDAGRADGLGARREDPLLRQLHLSGTRDRRGAVGGRASGPGAFRDRAAAVLHSGAQH